MANVSVPNDFTANTLIQSSQVDGNFAAIVDYVNARNQASAAWDALSVTGATTLSSTLAVTGVTTLTGGVASLFGYRRPNLVYSSATAVNVESNTGTSNQTTIIFPDGTVRSVTEDVASTHKYRQFLITATAEFTSGTEDSGLRSGLSEANNTWYAIYAVKSQINAANFVLVGDTTLPLQANFGTLNSAYGTNSWVYLGMIRNGDVDQAQGDILSFVQSGSITSLTHKPNFTSAMGVPLAANASSTLAAWEYAAGTGEAQLPNHILIADISTESSSANTVTMFTYDQTKRYLIISGASGASAVRLSHCSVVGGFYLTTGATGTQRILLSAYQDSVLAAGINPII
jgi:hypothetical protein